MSYKTALIKAPKDGEDQVRYENGLTDDIIETVMYADKKAAWYTSLFAPTLKKKTLIETCRNIWHFVKTEIQYQVDPSGEQYIKSPGRLWKTKHGDCKSFSLFTASCLRNLGIPYGYRFTSYSNSSPTPTHVYVYVPLATGGEIILDSVWTGPFNTQKEYTFKQDHLMSKIAYLGSINGPQPKKAKAPHVPTEFRLTKDWDQITDGEMDLLLARQRLEIEKANTVIVAGPFNWQIDKYDKAIGTIQAALDNIDNPEVIEGMGEEMEQRAMAAGNSPAVGSIFKKIGKAIGKGVKAVGKGLAKVVLFVPKLIAKGIMEIYLPKAAMMFLYLFAEEKMLTDKMRAKRKKAQKFKDFVVKKLNMKEKHFMGIVRNSLTKKLHMSPESFLAKGLKAVAVKGIGDISKAKRRVNKKTKSKTKKYAPLSTGQQDALKNLFNKGYGGEIVNRDFENANEELSRQNYAAQQRKTPNKNIQTVKSLANSLTRGDVGGAIMAAISWILSKLGGKKEGVSVSADDLPDLEGDTGNAFNTNDLNNNYGNIPGPVMQTIRDVVTEHINNGSDYGTARNDMSKFSMLTEAQKDEMAYQSTTGFEPADEEELNDKANQIKRQGDGSLEDLYNTGGRTAPGMCKC